MLATKQLIIDEIKTSKFIKEYIEYDDYIYFSFKNYQFHSLLFNKFRFDHPVHGMVYDMDRWDGKYFDIYFSTNEKKNRYIILKTTVLEFNLNYCNINNINNYDALGAWIKEFMNDYKPNKKTEKAYVTQFTYIRNYFSPLGQKFNKYLLPLSQAIEGE
jgi:hypothetical protein